MGGVYLEVVCGEPISYTVHVILFVGSGGMYKLKETQGKGLSTIGVYGTGYYMYTESVHVFS